MSGVAPWLDAIYRRNIFSGAVLLARVGQICFEGQYGYADLADTVPLTRHSSFSVASLTKQFTAMAMLMLAHGGRLRLDDGIARYLPELNIYQGVTIRQMLHHTSGLPDYMALADRQWDRGRIITARDVVAMLEQFRPQLVFRPGDEFEYNNTGEAALRFGTLLPVAVCDQAYVSGTLNSGASTGYGYGWEIISPYVVEHWGNWEGFTAHIRRDLRQHTL
ncbi:MAG: beta-lactamase family protein, partial [Bradyrhizobium sp.]|nr:beta-lactamase family protein [Bradyrhizobium sp.]